MPNLVSVLKAEVARLARKELRDATDGLKRSVAAQRVEIAALKRRVQNLEKQLKVQTRAAAKGRPATFLGHQADTTEGGDDAVGGLRFRAAGMASNRKRLGLSAEDFGLLVGATGQSIYAWERGKSKPRTRNLAAIAALRRLGKREVSARLAELKQST